MCLHPNREQYETLLGLARPLVIQKTAMTRLSAMMLDAEIIRLNWTGAIAQLFGGNSCLIQHGE